LYHLTWLVVIGIQVVRQFRYFRQAKKLDTLVLSGALTILLFAVTGCSGGGEDNQTTNSTIANVESPGLENTSGENTGSESPRSENPDNENPGSESPGLPDQIDQGSGWQGTWARLHGDSKHPDASLLQRNFYLPSAHYNDAEGNIYGAEFTSCLRFPHSTGETSLAWENAARIPDMQPLLTLLGDSQFVFSTVGFSGGEYQRLGDYRFHYQHPLLKPNGVELRKISSEFRANSIWLSKVPGHLTEQTGGCAAFEWETNRDQAGTQLGWFSAVIPTRTPGADLRYLSILIAFRDAPQLQERRYEDDGHHDDPRLSVASFRVGIGSEHNEFSNFVPLDNVAVDVHAITLNSVELTVSGTLGTAEVSTRGIIYASPSHWPLSSFQVNSPDTDPTVGSKRDRDADGYDDSWDAYPDNPSEWLDSDGDGIGNNSDTDDDADNIADSADEFPRYAYYDIDTDGDGEPDQHDDDDDDDGIPDQQDDDSKDPSVGARVPTIKPDAFAAGDNGTVYLLVRRQSRLYRWSLPEQRFLQAIEIGDAANSQTPSYIAYSGNHQRLYLGYTNGRVTYLPLQTETPSEVVFTELDQTLRGLTAVGEHILLASDNTFRDRYFYDRNAVQTDSHDTNADYGRNIIWNAASQRLFYIDGSYIEYLELTDAGTVSDTGRSLRLDDELRGPLLHSPDNSLILFATGDYFDIRSLERLGTLGSSFSHGTFLPDGSLAVIKGTGDESVLTRYDSTLSESTEPVPLLGEPLGLTYYNNSLNIFLTRDNQISVVCLSAIDTALNAAEYGDCTGGDTVSLNSLRTDIEPVRLPEPLPSLTHADIPFSTTNSVTLLWPNDFPVSVETGKTILVQGLDAAWAYNFNLLPANDSDRTTTTLYALNESTDGNSSSVVCIGEPDCAGVVGTNNILLHVKSSSPANATLDINRLSRLPGGDIGNRDNPLTFPITGDRASIDGNIGAAKPAGSIVYGGQSFFRVSDLTVGDRYRINIEQSDSDTLDIQWNDNTESTCDPYLSEDFECSFVAVQPTFDIAIADSRESTGAAFRINVNRVSAGTEFEGSWHTPLDLETPVQERIRHIGVADQYGSIYRLSNLDPQRRYRFLLTGRTAVARLSIDRLATPVDEDTLICDVSLAPTASYCAIEGVTDFQFRVKGESQTVRYLLTVEVEVKSAGSINAPVMLTADNGSLQHLTTVMSARYYRINNLLPGARYFLSLHSYWPNAAFTLTDDSQNNYCRADSTYCQFTASLDHALLDITDRRHPLDSPLIITLTTHVPPAARPPNEQTVLARQSFPYKGTVGRNGESQYTITGLTGGGYYMVELKLPSEETMALSVSTTACQTQGTLTGSGCLVLANPDGTIEMDVSTRGEGGTFTLDINDNPLEFDIAVTNQYFSVAPPSNFPDVAEQGISSDIFVDSFNPVKKLHIAVSIIHHDSRELSIKLEAPDGRIIVLSEDRRWDDIQKAIYTDYALAPVTVSGARHYQAFIRPVEPLHVLDDMSAYGTWRLHVSDEVNNYNYASDGGVLLKWGIAFD